MDFLHRTWAEIDLSALVHNFSELRRSAGNARLMAVVKANAYGHSADIVVPALDACGADAFAVSNIEEAISLRELGITKPVLILGYTPPSCAGQLAQRDISQCVFSSEYAAALSKEAVANGVKIKIHIKLDTGMGRIGFDCRNDTLAGIADAIDAARMDGFLLEGLFTHFAESDLDLSQDRGFTERQFALYCAALARLKAAGLSPAFCHCCNSAALCLDSDKHLNFCRPGIVLYGLTPAYGLQLKENLTPVMTFKSIVSMVKTIRKGETVSYGRTFRAESEKKVATVTVGYADGYPRLLSGKGEVLIRGQRAKVLGRVCMDQILADVTAIDGVAQGDEVILFGKDLPVEELAELCGTINYEIVCGVSARVPRIAIQGETP